MGKGHSEPALVVSTEDTDADCRAAMSSRRSARVLGPRLQLLHPLGSAGRDGDEVGDLFFKLACMLAMLLVRWAGTWAHLDVSMVTAMSRSGRRSCIRRDVRNWDISERVLCLVMDR